MNLHLIGDVFVTILTFGHAYNSSIVLTLLTICGTDRDRPGQTRLSHKRAVNTAIFQLWDTGTVLFY